MDPNEAVFNMGDRPGQTHVVAVLRYNKRRERSYPSGDPFMKASVLSLLLALCLLAGASALLAAQGPARAVESSVGPNLLNNPSFEHPYGAYNPPGGHGDCQWGPCNSAQTAAGWTPYWRPGYES